MPGEPRPKLIPLEPKPVQLEDGSSAIALRDPYGVIEGMAVVSPAAYWVLAHFDGRRRPSEVVAALQAAGLRGVRPSDVQRIASQAHDAGLVFGAPYQARLAAALASFRSRPRAPACAGGAYPDDEASLRELLAGYYDHPDGPGPRRAGSRAGAGVRLLVAPHIDFHRGGPAYAHAYQALEGCDADLYVVFGTAHASPPHLYTLTRQDYATPLGRVATDRAVVNALAAELGEEELFAHELVHVGEHSCEFQMVWLRWVLGDRSFRAVPVLCSSISQLRDPVGATERFLAALARATAGRRVCFVAGADLAHVGPQYGDERPPTPGELERLASQDRSTLEVLSSGDAPGFHHRARADDGSRRLCGIAPIFAAMRAAGRGARLLHYAQWTDGTDMVSFAAAAG